MKRDKKLENKEELEKKLYQIDEKLNLKETQIKNSPEYDLLGTTQSDLWKKRSEKERELKELEKPIHKKYVLNYSRGWRMFRIKNIKSSVKQGIKDGLKITNVSFIDEYDLIHIVEQLINKDLEKIKMQTDKLRSEIKDIDTQIDKCDENQVKLMRGLDALAEQRKKIDNELYKKEYLKNKIIEKKKKDVKIKIQKHFQDFMDKIIKEVNKRLILDGLEE